MKVKELIAKLNSFDGEDLVILSSDEEGNSYRELHDLWTANYDIENREVGLRELTPELINYGYNEEDIQEGVPCVVFY